MYKNDMTCRACGHPLEDQNHVLVECKTIHPNDTTKVTPDQIFTEHIPTLKTTAKKIQEATNKLEKPAITNGEPTSK